jgi:hypothetical protein
MGDIRAVGKDSKNTTPGANYMFRGIDAVMNAAGPAFRAHGVVVVPHKVQTIEYTTVTVGKNQTVMASVRVVVKYRIYGPAGDWFKGEAPGEAFDSGDKATSKAMSVAYRTLLIQALTLPTGDQDPDSETHERSGHDHTAAQARDIGQWRGRVQAAGRDKAKLKALWDQMKAEWETVAWSQERLDILQPAVDAMTQPAPAAEVVAEAPPQPTEADDAERIEGDFLTDLDQCIEARDGAGVRALMKRAADMGRPDLRKIAQAALDDLRGQGGKR